jgi:hypothetical protein
MRTGLYPQSPTDTVHDSVHLACLLQSRAAMAAQSKFFLVPLVSISFPNRIDAWVRLCTHLEAAKVMTFTAVT